MPFLEFANRKVFYDYQPNKGPVVVFINGLTQSTSIWADYKKYFSKFDLSTLCFDIPGQGQSELPEQRLSYSDMASIIAALLDHLNIAKAYIVGISFGGTIAIHFSLQHSDRIIGLIAMGGHSEKDTLFKCIHRALIDAIGIGGIPYLFDFLTALNFSHEWIEKNKKILELVKKICVANNTDTAIRNFLETIVESQDVTDQLHKIDCPTLIMCGENDVFTPRWCQEILRENIANSSLVIIQNVCHAFTIESPSMAKQIFAWFIQQMEAGKWVGDQAAWIAAADETEGFKLIPCKRKR